MGGNSVLAFKKFSGIVVSPFPAKGMITNMDIANEDRQTCQSESFGI
jgi:hypothetical protein